jgi:signal transduction histidine kinase
LTGATVRAYLLGIGATMAALAVTRFTWPLFAPTPFAPVFAAIAATSHWGSGTAGLVATLLATGGAPLAFPPSWNPRTLFVFVPIAVFSSRIIAGRKQAIAALRTRERELRATVAAQRQAELELRASEQKLRQAQKMEAIGQLVAGVAHNFNNLLTVTLGYTDVLLERHPQDLQDEDHADLTEIRKASQRGAALTRQLLAFGHKHDAALARIDLNRTIADLRDVLTRVTRQDIDLTIDVTSAPLAVVIDPQDIEQVLLNLVLNARDALPAGGRIDIDIARQPVDPASGPRDTAAAPGDYARIRVRDNGTGMTPEVQAHLFEPFFTTKEVGEGTGLGLAFVHGIVRHGGGFVIVETAPAKGTTVSVYLPLA